MIEKTYRTSTDRAEIIKVLESKFSLQSVFTVWQKNKDGNRSFITEAKFKKMDPQNGIFSVFIEQANLKKFDLELETFFLLNGEDFVFKTIGALVQSYVPEEIHFQVPKEVRLKENRKHPRTYIPENDFINAKVTFETKKKNKFLYIECRIFNISAGGIGLIISKETISIINLKKYVQIDTSAYIKSHTGSKKALIRNARVFSKKSIKSDETFSLGLEFVD